MNEAVLYVVAFAQNLPGISSAIFAMAGVAGFLSIIFALTAQVSDGRRGQSPMPATIAGVIVGSFLLSLTTFVEVSSRSFLGTSADPQIIDSYTSVAGADNVRIGIQAIVAIINVVGWFAVARGLWRWRNGPKYDQPGWFSSGFVFILAGVSACNLYVIANITAVSVGAQPLGTEYFQFS